MLRPQDKRQVVTAMGLSCALGDGVDAVWRGVMAGEPRAVTPPFALPFATVCGEVQGPLLPLPDRYRAYDTRLTRLAQRGLAQLRPAVERARSRFGGQRIGVIVGTSTGGLDATEPAYRAYRATEQRDSGFSLRRSHAFDAIAVWLGAELQLTGPAYTVSTACTSSAKALASARRLLRSGACDAVLVAGVDALCETTLRGFHGLSVLSQQSARPFSANRDGIHIGEAAAFLLLENNGDGAAYLRGVGESSDAHSMSAPHPEGRGAALAMQTALQDAGLSAADVDYLNAHGTGTPQNDSAEGLAVHSVFGGDIAMSSTKGLTGHTLGACGALEAALAVLSIVHGEVPKSVGAQPLDPNIAVRALTANIRKPVRSAMSNALAFGGNNVSLLLAAT